MNKEFNSYSSGALLSFQPKPRKVASGKRKKSRDSSKEKQRKSKDSRLNSSPGKFLTNKYIPQSSTNTLIYKNSVDDPKNLKFTSSNMRPTESAFKNLVYSPQGKLDKKK